MAPLPHPRLSAHLLRSYAPCKLLGICRHAQFDARAGYIPRGYLGATAELHDVAVVLVFAEPGFPHDSEKHDRYGTSPQDMMQSAVDHTYQCFKHGTDQFHRNVRFILDSIFPEEFDSQLRRSWLTDARLCSIDKEIGGHREDTCAQEYLSHQLESLPNAITLAFGGKAVRTLKRLGREFRGALALAPPGCNFTRARPSWQSAIEDARSHITRLPFRNSLRKLSLEE